MLRLIVSLALGASLAACSLDSVDSGEDLPDGPVPERIPSDDPAVDERLDDLEIICETTLTVTGTVQHDPARPGDAEGCYELGTWTITPTVNQLGCDIQPELAPSYTYTVYVDNDEIRNIDYPADPDVQRVQFNISTNGGGTCNANFEHFGTDDVWDGWVLSLHPVLHQDGTVDGTGALSYYSFDPF